MIRPPFPCKMINDLLSLVISLYDLLQNSLAIIKEFFMFNICQDKFMDKLFCISKTTIQINRADQSLHCVRNNGIPPSSSGSLFPFSKQQIIAQL